MSCARQDDQLRAVEGVIGNLDAARSASCSRGRKAYLDCATRAVCQRAAIDARCPGRRREVAADAQGGEIERRRTRIGERHGFRNARSAYLLRAEGHARRTKGNLRIDHGTAERDCLRASRRAVRDHQNRRLRRCVIAVRNVAEDNDAALSGS